MKWRPQVLFIEQIKTKKNTRSSKSSYHPVQMNERWRPACVCLFDGNAIVLSADSNVRAVKLGVTIASASVASATAACRRLLFNFDREPFALNSMKHNYSPEPSETLSESHNYIDDK